MTIFLIYLKGVISQFSQVKAALRVEDTQYQLIHFRGTLQRSVINQVPV